MMRVGVKHIITQTHTDKSGLGFEIGSYDHVHTVSIWLFSHTNASKQCTIQMKI